MITPTRQAGDIEEAHRVLCTTVGPQAVIEQDYDGLSQLLQHFGGRKVVGWEQGGQVFADFLQLVRAPPSRRHTADQEATMQRLKNGLKAMGDGGTKRILQERVALIEMGKVLEAQDDGEKDQAMTGTDRHVSGARSETDLLRRYRAAMVSAA